MRDVTQQMLDSLIPLRQKKSTLCISLPKEPKTGTNFALSKWSNSWMLIKGAGL